MRKRKERERGKRKEERGEGVREEEREGVGEEEREGEGEEEREGEEEKEGWRNRREREEERRRSSIYRPREGTEEGKKETGNIMFSYFLNVVVIPQRFSFDHVVPCLN